MDPSGYFRLKSTKKRSSTCKTAIMDPSIIVDLQVRETYLAQNPIKGAKRKNRPRQNYGLDPARALKQI